VWYNMYFSGEIGVYEESIWTHAMGGGRINFHPIYVSGTQGKMDSILERHVSLFRGGLMRGNARIRLLDLIVKAPLDCSVAVVFGQACAMNWAGPAYKDTGLRVAEDLWRAGYPADLIPDNEIRTGALKVGKDGYIWYGPQRYQAVLLYHPEFEQPEKAEFWRAAAGGKTRLYRVGEWKLDFEGRPLQRDTVLPDAMTPLPNGESAVAELVTCLNELKVAQQTPSTNTMLESWAKNRCAPPPTGQCRLLDGTQILLAGAKQVTGDPIQTSFDVGGRPVNVDAVGVVGIRLTSAGRLDAFAAGGLKRLEAGDLKIELPERVDVAFWHDEQGSTHGVLLGWHGPVPKALVSLTDDWLRIELPKPLE